MKNKHLVIFISIGMVCILMLGVWFTIKTKPTDSSISQVQFNAKKIQKSLPERMTSIKYYDTSDETIHHKNNNNR